ncbi:sugar kinase [Chryseobacterium sp. Leaf180]|uniref:bifunctional ADP-dependent NAD(P)H-hydrate dehydratase/NAD(P)H-hydrate epimerase n=1 Tax=Chryseobacterium sp. Leaf180 TaxID=1736289 RepID=UPI0006F4B339|nr:bifunctional ADP-dependent NAD(P)H-hydrate dehydratase/NAD(P)H-hydrate epimerase [Chryseobacterium sp. Leaf180]KQR94912.1 sugar kinase [Chryseobacterium sp. Leaf180]
MKIYPAEKIREADRQTIQEEQISSADLMERAAKASYDWLVKSIKSFQKIAVFCGSGNNGGDGFAVARMLCEKGFQVFVFHDHSKEKISDDAKINLDKLSGTSVDLRDFSEADHFDFAETLIVDAILGTGFTGKINKKLSKVISALNKISTSKISIDIPSGMSADLPCEDTEEIFKADFTLSFQFWKRSFLHPECGKFAGNIQILDIGISKKFLQENDSDYSLIGEDLILKIFKPRNEFGNKGTFGKVMLVAGSFGKTGAAVLCTHSALKSGAGLVVTQSSSRSSDILQVSCPEAMFIGAGNWFVEKIYLDEKATFGLGPGLGTDELTEKALFFFLKNHIKPVVLDADALNILASDKKYLLFIPEKSIITPHPKEFERLFGKTSNSFERLELARKMAELFNITIVLKDHHTQIITPEKEVFYNVTGNSGLAKGGSGDILTGIITSLLAQNYTPNDAALLGVWLHGTAADLAAERLSHETMLPSDVIAELSSVFKKLNEKVTKKL